MIAYKFLAEGGLSPFTGFRWPNAGEWVRAPGVRDDAWVHACRPQDLPYWLEDELWEIELERPVKAARYQVASPRARLVAPIAAWGVALRNEYARACALHARDVALPHLAPALRESLARLEDLAEIAAVAGAADPSSRIVRYAADAAHNALRVGAATASYIACVLASAVGGGIAAFEAERKWQALWLAERLGIEPATRR